MIIVAKHIGLLGVFILLTSCIKQEDVNTLVPDTRVDFTVSPAFIPLQGSPHVRYGQGYNANGVVLFNYGSNSFRAFDLTCPTECLEAMEIDTSGIMTCKTCEDEKISFTQYQIKIKVNKVTYYLKEYYATLQGNNIRITNY
ncbi:MAG: hypothetical protein ACN4EF_01355 [Wenyingzhuangia sp.]|jgi:hypothetical protein|uniref:hypothetical protein n=1 Tax=Wenyingzhuangia sp. TaxID=1964193 RepID=UPI003219BEEA